MDTEKQQKVEAFAKEIEEVQKKHGMRIVPTLEVAFIEKPVLETI